MRQSARRREDTVPYVVSQRAFTMVEIALCLAIIGFALVAIIGVLPSGMAVQRDNRSDTIINQDGLYWMNAIRSGSTGKVDLVNFVHWVDDPSNTNFTDSAQIIGLLSVPTGTNSAHRASVRAISGSAVERDKDVIGFDYILFSQVQPFTNLTYAFPSNATYATLARSLYEVRLTFRWPVMPDGTNYGTEKKVFRSLVSGQLLPDTNRVVGTSYPYYFFHSKSLE